MQIQIVQTALIGQVIVFDAIDECCLYKGFPFVLNVQKQIVQAALIGQYFGNIDKQGLYTFVFYRLSLKPSIVLSSAHVYAMSCVSRVGFCDVMCLVRIEHQSAQTNLHRRARRLPFVCFFADYIPASPEVVRVCLGGSCCSKHGDDVLRRCQQACFTYTLRCAGKFCVVSCARLCDIMCLMCVLL